MKNLKKDLFLNGNRTLYQLTSDRNSDLSLTSFVGASPPVAGLRCSSSPVGRRLPRYHLYIPFVFKGHLKFQLGKIKMALSLFPVLYKWRQTWCVMRRDVPLCSVPSRCGCRAPRAVPVHSLPLCTHVATDRAALGGEEVPKGLTPLSPCMNWGQGSGKNAQKGVSDAGLWTRHHLQLFYRHLSLACYSN